MGFRRFAAAAGLAVGLGLAWLAPASAAELIYYHGASCSYCEAWDATVAPIYPKTDEGARLPLRRVSSGEPWPKDLAHIKGVVFTPTFIAVDDSGKEIGRIAGYQPDWFWAFLRKFIDTMDAKQG
jgi:thioredoxin-related protein